MDLSTLDFALEKLRSVLHQLQELDGSSFPHQDASDALAELQSTIVKLIETIEDEKRHDPDEVMIGQLCRRSSVEISAVLEVLGLILNSTGVKNAFELYSPLVNLAKRIVSEKIKLVLSYEYNYIPFTYPLTLPSLPNFIIIGLPASESGNALVLPAAGHELGHSIWRHRKLSDHFGLLVRNLVKKSVQETHRDKFLTYFPEIDKYEFDDPKAMSIWSMAHTWACLQLEEVFCDLVGLYIFGPAFAHAFAYLISPTLSEERTPEYPSSASRAKYIKDAAEIFSISLPSNFGNLFENERPPPQYQEIEQLYLEIADSVTDEIVPEIISEVQSYLSSKQVSPPEPNSWKKVSAAFNSFVPAENLSGLPDIINAGWDAYLNLDFLSSDNHSPPPSKSQDKRRLVFINELVLKTIEVLEIEDLLEKSNAS